MISAKEMILAEGTKQYRPSSGDFGNIRIGDVLQPDLQIRFATYVASAAEQLKVRVKDHTRERIYFGFKVTFGTDVYFRVRDPNGAIVIPSTLVPTTGQGYIDNYNQAFNGPSQINSGGYNAMILDPLISGDYIIEFNAGDPVVHSGAEFVLDLFDITIYDTVDSEVKTGRLWSQTWAGNTGNFDNPFVGKFYIYSPTDSTLSVFELNGMKPFTFEIFANSTGPVNTGDVGEDRKSLQGKKGNPEYYLFLNIPDSTEFPFTQIQAQFLSQPVIEKCGDDFCINIEVNKRGFVEAFIELNDIPGFQKGSADVSFLQKVDPGVNVIQWNGFNGLGENVSVQDDILVTIDYGSTPTHIPIFDVESNPNGFKATTLKPVFQVENLHFDDSKIAGGGIDLEGCETPCHNWVPASGCCNSIGNSRTINTWWYNNKNTELWIVNSTNVAPEVNDDLVGPINVNSSIQIDYLNNDTDPNSNLDINSFDVLSGPSNGSFEVDVQSGLLTYTPATDFIGNDTIVYMLCDDGLPVYCATAEIIIEVNSDNRPPVANDDNYSMDNLELLQVMYSINDTDPNDDIDRNSFTVLSDPKHGDLIVDDEGRVFYSPNAGFFGVDSIHYQICDTGTPVFCDDAYIIVTVEESPLCKLKVFDGFSPNGDGINDHLIINGIDCYPDNHVKIFNRWGNLVFEVSGYNNNDLAWDGTANSGLLINKDSTVPNGTYFYVIDLSVEREPLTGYVVVKK